MEFPRRALIAERLLAALFLAAALAASWAESRSTFAARVRDGRPWLAWVEAREPGSAAAPRLSLAVYQPTPRRLTLLHVPGELKLEGRRTLERAYLEAVKRGADPDDAAHDEEAAAEARLRELSAESLPEIDARLSVRIPALDPEDEPALETARALRGRGFRAADASSLDRLLFALDLRRVPPNGLQPARLPPDDLIPAFLARILSADERPNDDRTPVVEVLNGAGEPGLAFRAAKVLRSRGFDVLATGSVAARARTLVYDRVGDYGRAARALDALGCPAARAVTRLDPSRAVDVSVALGDDCSRAFGAAGAKEQP